MKEMSNFTISNSDSAKFAAHKNKINEKNQCQQKKNQAF